LLILKFFACDDIFANYRFARPQSLISKAFAPDSILPGDNAPLAHLELAHSEFRDRGNST
jgi:hypothetical protein